MLLTVVVTTASQVLIQEANHFTLLREHAFVKLAIPSQLSHVGLSHFPTGDLSSANPKFLLDILLLLLNFIL